MQDQQQPVPSQLQKQVLDRSSKHNLQDLPPIPDKLYFSIGEASKLCLVKSHVLRYWEQEFTQLSPAKRRGKRRFYQRHDILLVRQIKDLLYKQGFTIEGARFKLSENNKGSSAVDSDAGRLVKGVISKLQEIVEELEHA